MQMTSSSVFGVCHSVMQQLCDNNCNMQAQAHLQAVILPTCKMQILHQTEPMQCSQSHGQAPKLLLAHQQKHGPRRKVGHSKTPLKVEQTMAQKIAVVGMVQLNVYR